MPYRIKTAHFSQQKYLYVVSPFTYDELVIACLCVFKIAECFEYKFQRCLRLSFHLLATVYFQHYFIKITLHRYCYNAGIFPSFYNPSVHRLDSTVGIIQWGNEDPYEYVHILTKKKKKKWKRMEKKKKTAVQMIILSSPEIFHLKNSRFIETIIII